MLESPLVPDDSTPGTMDPLRSARPLTRRELREREAAQAVHEVQAGQAATATPAAPVAQAASTPTQAPVSAAPPAPVRPAFDDLFGGRPAAARTQPAQPARPAQPESAARFTGASPTGAPQTERARSEGPTAGTERPASSAGVESSRRARRAFDPAQQAPAVPPIPTASPLAIPAATEITGLDIFGLQIEAESPAAEAAATAAVPAAERRQRHPASRQAEASAHSPRRAASAAGAGTAPHQGRRRSTSDAGARVDQAAPTRSISAKPSRRRARGLASIVAMSFVAMLAVATTIPALSLLSEDDVQALALSQYGTDSIDGQRMLINGDVVAQSVDREGYASQTIEEYAEAAGIRPEATFTNNPSGTIQWPFAVGVHIGDRFGYRDCAGCSEDHHGQDFNPGYGAEIQAIADGVVSESTDEGGSLGVVTMIDHQIDGQTITSVYAHMQYDSRRFEVGDTVHVGDVLGNTGTTGMSTGPHLHFEIRIGGIKGEWVDPLDWLYANTN
ncbi:peptidoglycan DD-metalloendopeptidase family protein [Agromyces sp. PvR057]|uniref:peptidoglycan DD-metalloendopeptidase family protein n=1 Tax=Agromyces sp. PvR057 TaxID=3156403 RepID=UPI000E38A5DF